MTGDEGLSREQITRDAAAIGLRMTLESAKTSTAITSSMLAGVRNWATCQREITGTLRRSLTALGREYVRQVRQAG